MPKTFEMALKKGRTEAVIKTDTSGYPIIRYETNDPRVRIDYPVTSQESEPTIAVTDADMLTPSEAKRLAQKLPETADMAQMTSDVVHETFRLPRHDPLGSSDERAEAIADMIERGDEVTALSIDEAIASVTTTDGRSAALRTLDAVRNRFANDEIVTRLADEIETAATGYVIARDREQELAHAADYDQAAHHAADARRTRAHERLITLVTQLGRIARDDGGMENDLTRFADMENPRSAGDRETIARFAYDLVENGGTA